MLACSRRPISIPSTACASSFRRTSRRRFGTPKRSSHDGKKSAKPESGLLTPCATRRQASCSEAWSSCRWKREAPTCPIGRIRGIAAEDTHLEPSPWSVMWRAGTPGFALFASSPTSTTSRRETSRYEVAFTRWVRTKGDSSTHALSADASEPPDPQSKAPIHQVLPVRVHVKTSEHFGSKVSVRVAPRHLELAQKAVAHIVAQEDTRIHRGRHKPFPTEATRSGGAAVELQVRGVSTRECDHSPSEVHEPGPRQVGMCAKPHTDRGRVHERFPAGKIGTGPYQRSAIPRPEIGPHSEFDERRGPLDQELEAEVGVSDGGTRNRKRLKGEAIRVDSEPRFGPFIMAECRIQDDRCPANKAIPGRDRRCSRRPRLVRHRAKKRMSRLEEDRSLVFPVQGVGLCPRQATRGSEDSQHNQEIKRNTQHRRPSLRRRCQSKCLANDPSLARSRSRRSLRPIPATAPAETFLRPKTYCRSSSVKVTRRSGAWVRSSDRREWPEPSIYPP